MLAASAQLARRGRVRARLAVHVEADELLDIEHRVARAALELGDVVVGTIPAAIAELDAVVALSLVGTRLHGSLPPQLGKMASLEMLWLDHNPDLSGPIPASFEALSPKLTAFELHRSNFTGRLPKLDWAAIADCTLNDLVFDCPLPEGAETCGAACR